MPPIRTVGPWPVEVARSVRERTRTDLPALLGEIADWVSIDSPTGDLAAVDAMAHRLAGRLAEWGAKTELLETPDGHYLHARVDGPGEGRVALLCHHDTVFRAGTARARPMTTDGDLARGPGVADMKGGVLVAAHVLRLFAADETLRSGVRTIELISVPDEELRTMPFRTIDRLRGFDAVLCMECGRPGNGIVTARKGGHWATLSAEGLSAHAGVAADRGRSALLAACREALRISGLDGVRAGLGVHVTTLSAGEVLNSVPSAAEMIIDVRAWHPEDLDWGLEQLAAVAEHEGVRLTFDAGPRVPPMERTAGVAALAAAAAELGVMLDRPLNEVSTGGVSDACWTAGAGIPTLDGLGPIGDDDHSPNEWIEISSIPDRCGLVAGLVAAVPLAQHPKDGERL
ncbi:MAG: glutamate carboxypeptidase [Gaiellales bacterium]|nr:glutamate carboxypeptidase [Gaiellales bacterium]